MKRLVLLSLVVLLVTLACGINVDLTDVPAPAEDALGTMVAATLTAVSASGDQASTQPPAPESESPTAVPNITTSSVPQPIGVLAALDSDPMTYYDLNGQAVTSWQTPDMYSCSPGGTHLAGGASTELANLPLLISHEGKLIQYTPNTTGTVYLSVEPSYISELRGVPGQPVMAYALADWQSDALISNIFAGNLGTLPGLSAPTINYVDPKSWALRLMAVEAENGQATGVWYSYIPYGIGGDIVFTPGWVLQYYDVATGVSTQYLGEDHTPSALSPDHSWVAYRNSNWGEDPNPLVIRNLATSQTVTMPLEASSNRGAGNAVFSPSNQYIAWMEGSGWMMAETPNFQSRVRIADLNGALMADLPAAAFSGFMGGGTVSWTQPRGWLNDQTLLIEIRAENWSDTSLVTVKFDGSNLSLLTGGTFCGFVYP